MDNKHCPDHVEFSISLTKIASDVAWIKKIANFILVAFISTGVLAAIGLWFWKGLRSAVAGGN